MKKQIKKVMVAMSLMATSATSYANISSDEFLNYNEYSKSDSYFDIGYVNSSLDFKSEITGVKHSVSGINSLSLGYGYKLADNVAIELNAIIPLSGKDFSAGKDTYVDMHYDDATQSIDSFSEPVSVDYQNSVETYIVSLDFKLDFPLNKHFDAFINLGYAYGNLKATTYHNKPDYSFEDHKPSSDPLGDYNGGQSNTCLLTGNESFCNSPIIETYEKINEFGANYGAGIRFYFEDRSALTLMYSKFDMKSFESDTLQVRYEKLF